ncbi:MAG: YncE family protein [Steroidobacteraceae bacterium]
MRATFAAAVFQLLTLPALAQTAAPAARAPAVLTLTGRIPLARVRGRMDHVSVDVSGRRLFAAAFDNHTLEVIDLAAGRQVRTLELDEPQQSYFVPSVNRLFVASSGDGTVKIFDGSTFALVRTVHLSSDADNMRYDAVRKHVLVDYGGEKYLFGTVSARNGEKDGAVAVMDLKGSIVGRIHIGGHPEALQLEQKTGDRVFINDPDKHEIVVADLSRYKVLARWRAGCENYPMALDEAHHRLFIFCRDHGYVAVFDTGSGRKVASVRATPGASSDDMFWDSSKSRLYVLARMLVHGKSPHIAGPGVVDVIHEEDPDHYRLIATSTTGFGAQTGMFVPDWGKLFVAARRQPNGQSAEILEYDTR